MSGGAHDQLVLRIPGAEKDTTKQDKTVWGRCCQYFPFKVGIHVFIFTSIYAFTFTVKTNPVRAVGSFVLLPFLSLPELQEGYRGRRNQGAPLLRIQSYEILTFEPRVGPNAALQVSRPELSIEKRPKWKATQISMEKRPKFFMGRRPN